MTRAIAPPLVCCPTDTEPLLIGGAVKNQAHPRPLAASGTLWHGIEGRLGWSGRKTWQRHRQEERGIDKKNAHDMALVRGSIDGAIYDPKFFNGRSKQIHEP